MHLSRNHAIKHKNNSLKKCVQALLFGATAVALALVYLSIQNCFCFLSWKNSCKEKSHQENGHKTQRGKSLTKAAPPHFGAAEGTQAQLSWWRWWRMVAVQRLDTAQAPSLLCYHLLTAHCWSLCSPWRSVLTPHLLWCCDNQIGKEGSLKLLNIEFHFLLPSCRHRNRVSQHSHERNL